MKIEEKNRLRAQFRHNFSGPAWHGPSLMEVLEKVPAEHRLNRIDEQGNTIADLVAHITAWRVFAIKKLEGDDNYDVDAQMNFPDLTNLDEGRWLALLADLKVSQERLLTLLQEIPDNKLMEIVPGREYSFYFLLHGIVQHDLYHAGQMMLLNKSALSR